MAARREIGDVGVRSPEQIAALSAGRAIRMVWKNSSGGVPCEVSAGPDRCFVKWAPPASGIDLAGEAVRLAWARPFTPACTNPFR